MEGRKGRSWESGNSVQDGVCLDEPKISEQFSSTNRRIESSLHISRPYFVYLRKKSANEIKEKKNIFVIFIKNYVIVILVVII